MRVYVIGARERLPSGSLRKAKKWGSAAPNPPASIKFNKTLDLNACRDFFLQTREEFRASLYRWH